METTMAISLAALGLLAFLLCHGNFAELQNSEPAAKSLIGTWKNDLNSTTETNSVSNKGMSSGVYETAVSASDNPIRPSLLQIIQRQDPGPVFGFTIIFNLSGSYLVNKKGMEQLKTTWLLQREVESAAEDWGVPSLGASTFYRSK